MRNLLTAAAVVLMIVSCNRGYETVNTSIRIEKKLCDRVCITVIKRTSSSTHKFAEIKISNPQSSSPDIPFPKYGTANMMMFW